jgi:hypothetical protein
LALNRRPSHGYARQLSDEHRPRRPLIGVAVHDPKRQVPPTIDALQNYLSIASCVVGAVEPQRFGGYEIDHQRKLDLAHMGSSLGFAPSKTLST